jgi:hypothetical protein
MLPQMRVLIGGRVREPGADVVRAKDYGDYFDHTITSSAPFTIDSSSLWHAGAGLRFFRGWRRQDPRSEHGIRAVLPVRDCDEADKTRAPQDQEDRPSIQGQYCTTANRLTVARDYDLVLPPDRHSTEAPSRILWLLSER